MEDTPANLRTYWRLIRSNRNFRLLWTAQFVSEIGDWLYMVAIFSSLLELTGSAGVVVVSAGGRIGDRRNSRWIRRPDYCLRIKFAVVRHHRAAHQAHAIFRASRGGHAADEDCRSVRLHADR